MRFKDIHIYYGCNNFKNGSLKYKKGQPVLRKDPDKDWFVQYHFWDELNNKWVRIREYRGLNRYKGLEAKEQAARNLLIVVTDELERLYNPLTKSYDLAPSADPLDKYKHMPLGEALDYGLQQVLLNLKAGATRSGYKTSIKQWKEAFAKLEFTFEISGLKSKHIYAGWDEIKRARIEKGKTVKNNTQITRKAHLQSVLEVFRKLGVFEVNPADNMEMPKVPKKGEKYIPLTQQEVQLVSATTKEHDYRYHVYLKILFLIYIRPDEILGLHGEDFFFDTGFIRVLPSNSKSGEWEYVPIPDDLRPDLIALGIPEMNPHHYVFSDPVTLESGPERLAQYIIGKRWKELREELEMDERKKMYALKHTGGDARFALPPPAIPEGLTAEETLRMILEFLGKQDYQQKLKAISHLMRHADVATTKIYLTPTNDPTTEYLKANSPKF